MSRFIVRISPDESTPKVTLDKIRAIPGTKILDETPRMVLVEGKLTESKLREAIGERSGWKIFPERSIALPKPQPRPKKPSLRPKSSAGIS